MMEISFTNYPDWENIWVSIPRNMEIDALKLHNVIYRYEGIECTPDFFKALWFR